MGAKTGTRRRRDARANTTRARARENDAGEGRDARDGGHGDGEVGASARVRRAACSGGHTSRRPTTRNPTT